MSLIIWNLFNLKLQLHAIEAEPSLLLPADWICTQRVYFRDRYSSLCVLTCCSNNGAIANEHLYKVVNYVNCVNMCIYVYIGTLGILSLPHSCRACARTYVVFIESVLVMVLYTHFLNRNHNIYKCREWSLKEK